MDMVLKLAMIIALVLFLIPLWILVLDKLPKYLKLKKEELELNRDNFFYDIDFDAKRDLLDHIIDEEVQIYVIRNIAWQKVEDIYLNDEDQIKIIREITAIVYAKRLTPAVLSVLKYYYVFNTPEEIQKIVLDRVSIAVLNLSMGTNKKVVNIPL